MPINITRRSKWRDRREGIDKQELGVLWVAYQKASFMDKEAIPRVLGGSI